MGAGYDPNLTTIKGIRTFLIPRLKMSLPYYVEAEAQAVVTQIQKLIDNGSAPTHRNIHLHVGDAGDRWYVLSSAEEISCPCQEVVL